MNPQTDNLSDLIQSISKQSITRNSRKPTAINNEIAREKEIRNDNAVDDQKMKKWTLKRLFLLLSLEIAGIFILTTFQGFGSGEAWFKFHIEEWCLGLLVSGVFAQTIATVAIAVKHLFPKKS